METIIGITSLGHRIGKTVALTHLIKGMSNETVKVIPNEPEPIPFKAHPMLENLLYTPPLTRRERRLKERNAKKKLANQTTREK